MEYKTVFLIVAMLICVSPFVYWKTKPNQNEEQINETAEQKQDNTKRKYHRISERLLEKPGICHDMHIFLKPEKETKQISTIIVVNRVQHTEEKINYLKKHGINETSLIGIMLGLLIVSIIVSLADVLKVKREQRSNQSSPDSDFNIKCSLAEFANMKHARRDSLIPANIMNPIKKEMSPSSRGVAQLCRFESVGSAFSRMRRESISAAAAAVHAGTETPTTPPPGTIKTPLKLLGARPAPLLRRSSFPAVSLMDGVDPQRRRLSIESEDDSSPDTSRRRIRIIRRH